MNKYWFAVVVAALAASSACRKKEAPANPPALSAPDQPFPSDRDRTRSHLKPEAETTATNVPIQLTFRLYQKTVKASTTSVDTSLWGQIELKNVGKSKYLIQDEIFYEPRTFFDASEKRSGIYVEILDSKNKRVKVYRPWQDEIAGDSTASSPQTPEQAAESRSIDAMIAGWRQQGLTLTQIRDRLLDYSRSRPDELEEEKWRRRYKDPHAHLLPGQSTTTVAWARSPTIFRETPPGKPIGQFTQLTDYDLSPGHYRIRAVYDCVPSGRMKSKFPPLDFEVRVETPFIPFEVVR